MATGQLRVKQKTLVVIRQLWPAILLLSSPTLCAFSATNATETTNATEAAIATSAPVANHEIKAKLNPQQKPKPWRLYRKFSQFEMYSRDTRLGNRAVLEIQAQFVFKGTMSAFFWLLRDTTHAKNWLDSAESVRIIANPSPFEDWVHTVFDTPWPLQQRDMVTCSNWQQHTDYSIEMTVVGCTERWPVPVKTVRIDQVSARWSLKPLSDHQVQVVYTGTADAGGGLPRWLSDPVALASSLRSFRALQQQLTLPGYQLPLREVCEPESAVDVQAIPDHNTAACRALQRK